MSCNQIERTSVQIASYLNGNYGLTCGYNGSTSGHWFVRVLGPDGGLHCHGSFDDLQLRPAELTQRVKKGSKIC